jgi:hypothetical protein
MMTQPLRRAFEVALAIACAGCLACSFSYSSKGSSDSSKSSSDSSGSSSGENDTALFQKDVEQYTEAFVPAGGQRDEGFFTGLGDLARESNIWTSTLYTPADSSTFFVFFTDASWPLRPLLGAVNLGAALARAGVGVLQLPLDRGRGLRAGLEGALFSLPELFFANIRKGTSEYVQPELRPPPG